MTPAPNGDEDIVIFNSHPKKANECWSKNEYFALCEHLHNGNEDRTFIMAFQKDGKKCYVRSKRLSVQRAIPWSWATIEGKKKKGMELAFVPYSTNREKQSRWGGFDFDAHDGNFERARRLAFRCFQYLLNTELSIIFESSGSGGWHVWAISKNFRPVSQWSKFLKSVAREIDASIQSGICEIFPPDTKSNGVGLGMRAPGSWNPGTGTFSEIVWENTDELIGSLSLNREDCFSVGLPIKKEHNSFLSPNNKEKGIYKQWERQWSKEFRIDAQGTRHTMLCSLVGNMFYQVGRDMAALITPLHFKQATVQMVADLKEHLTDFDRLWSGMEQPWVAQLSELEKEKFNQLSSGNEKDAFRMFKNFHKLAQEQGANDFPIAIENLGERLGISTQGAGKLRHRFCEAGIIKRTQMHQPNKTAARFAWNLAQSI